MQEGIERDQGPDPAEYESPAVEQVLDREELAREQHYAGVTADPSVVVG